jgi:hypothetical protein
LTNLPPAIKTGGANLIADANKPPRGKAPKK